MREFDDLVQEGYIGICLAALHFDESAGTKFLLCTASWIKQRMRRHNNNCRSVVRDTFTCDGKYSEIQKVSIDYR